MLATNCFPAITQAAKLRTLQATMPSPLAAKSSGQLAGPGEVSDVDAEAEFITSW